MNFILISIDTLRADMTGIYRQSPSITPNIDSLSQSGIVFDQAITGGSWTQAAFPPLFTSTYASMYGGCLGRLSSERPSPIEALAQQGYTTAGFNTSPLLSRTYGYERGFQHYYDLIPSEKDPGLRKTKGGERLLRSPLTHFGYALAGKRARPARLYISGEELTTSACQWLSQADSPFFVWIHYMDTHWPYHLEEALTSPGEIAQAWKDIAHVHRVNRKRAPITTAQRERYLGLYQKALEYVDAQIAFLLEQLGALSLLENTAIILLSDHGEEFLERGRWGHMESNLYDEILKVPLLIRMPGLSKTHTVHRQVRTLDIMPTIMELSGCKSPPGMLGSSMASLWDPDRPSYKEELSISEMWRDHWQKIALRTEANKFVWDSRNPDNPELFDLVSDPNEKHNISRQHPDQTRYFQSVIAAHRENVNLISSTGPAANPDLDERVAQRLRDLGYLT